MDLDPPDPGHVQARMSALPASLLYPRPDSLFGWGRIIFFWNWKTLLYCLSVSSFQCGYWEVQFLFGLLIWLCELFFFSLELLGSFPPSTPWCCNIPNYVLWGDSFVFCFGSLCWTPTGSFQYGNSNLSLSEILEKLSFWLIYSPPFSLCSLFGLIRRCQSFGWIGSCKLLIFLVLTFIS